MGRSWSLHQRLVATIFFVTLFTLVSTAAVSYIALTSMKRNKTESAMAATLWQTTNHMDWVYLSMLQTSQQMLPQGTTGQLFQEYLTAASPYEAYRLKGQIGKGLVTLGFPNADLCMMAYYNQEEKINYFSSFTLQEGFSPTKEQTLVSVGSVKYQACHKPGRKYQKGLVVSLTRKANFFGASETVIYIESLIDQVAYIDSKSTGKEKDYQFPCVFLQADETGQICYSSNPEELNPEEGYQVTDFLEEGKTTGKTAHYFVVAEQSQIGYTNLLLIHLSDYKKEVRDWIREICLVGLLSLLLFYIATMTIQSLIYRPIKRLETEFTRLGEGSFECLDYKSGILEFDDLLEQFNEMKLQIQHLLRDVARNEKERHQLETEKLMYQINPHFLLNTLNSANWLAKIHKQKEISGFITDLISMLAYNLGKMNQRPTFRSEVEMLKNYINLQKTRYDFEAILEIEEGAYLDWQTIRMLLQPLVENAIRYGIGDQGIIFIKMFYDPIRGFVVITVQDQGKGLTREELKKLSEPFHYQGDGRSENNGIGLRYVRSMLETYYGGKAFLSINSDLGKGTKITLLLPYMEFSPEQSSISNDSTEHGEGERNK